MGYRKITVDGKQYEYIIGKTHTKVKGMKKVFENEKIGNICGAGPVYNEYVWNSDTGEEYQVAVQHDVSFQVTPKDVAEAIKSALV